MEKQTNTGTVSKLEAQQLEQLKKTILGNVLSPGDAEYDKARNELYNVVHREKKPLLIIQPRGTADVITAVNFARSSGVPISVKGGGHNSAGRSLIDNGLTIDLHKFMRGIHVNPITKTANVQCGALWNDFNWELHPHNLGTPGGIISTTGVSGLTLGGGWGWLTPQYGLACDNVLSADVVTADGKFVVCNEKQNTDLFWAIRGGGGNFGVVTNLEFQLYDVSPVVSGGFLLFSPDKADKLLEAFTKLHSNLPKKAVAFMGVTHVPPTFDLFLMCPTFYEGPRSEYEKIFKPLLDLDPMKNLLECPFRDFCSAFDGMFAPTRTYWKASFIKTSSFEQSVRQAIEEVKNSPDKIGTIVFENYFNGDFWPSIASDKTAFPHRSGQQYMLFVFPSWNTPEKDEQGNQWCKEIYSKFEKQGLFIGAALNFQPDDPDKVFSANKQKLVQIKSKYDPFNMFANTNNALKVEPK
jgi:hypothetical protein